MGESHTSIDFHRAQLRLVQELVAAGRPVLIGLEMYPYTEQEHLDPGARGYLTEDGFVTLSHWYDNWGYPWDYYRDVFLYARDHGLPLSASTPRGRWSPACGRRASRTSPRRSAPRAAERIDLDSDEHRRLFRAYFERRTKRTRRRTKAASTPG